jgi:hypothetical protein
MRLFTKLRGEQIKLIEYPALGSPAHTPTLPTANPGLDMRQILGVEASNALDAERLRKTQPPAEKTEYPYYAKAPVAEKPEPKLNSVNNNEPERNPDGSLNPKYVKPNQFAQPGDDGFTDDTPEKADEAKTEMIIITTIHGDSHELPKSDLLLAPAITERKDGNGNLTGPQIGDWFVQDYDIETDKPIAKVYDAKTFQRYFKASIIG